MATATVPRRTSAAQRAELTRADVIRRGRVITNPEALEAIDAELMLAIYDARRLARLRYIGVEAAPEPSARALELFRRPR